MVNVYDMTNVKTGDVVYTVWGYDEINVDFFQVVRTSAKSFWLRYIDYDIVSRPAWECEEVKPAKNSFDDEWSDIKFHKTILRKTKKKMVKIPEYGYLKKYTGGTFETDHSR